VGTLNQLTSFEIEKSSGKSCCFNKNFHRHVHFSQGIIREILDKIMKILTYNYWQFLSSSRHKKEENA
jgi:hypothetical protein